MAEKVHLGVLEHHRQLPAQWRLRSRVVVVEAFNIGPFGFLSLGLIPDSPAHSAGGRLPERNVQLILGAHEDVSGCCQVGLDGEDGGVVTGLDPC